MDAWRRVAFAAPATSDVSRGTLEAIGLEDERRYREVLAIDRAIASADGHEEVLRRVVDGTAALTGASGCMLLLSQKDGLARIVRSVGHRSAKVTRVAIPLTERIDVECAAFSASRLGTGSSAYR